MVGQTAPFSACTRLGGMAAPWECVCACARAFARPQHSLPKPTLQDCGDAIDFFHPQRPSHPLPATNTRTLLHHVMTVRPWNIVNTKIYDTNTHTRTFTRLTPMFMVLKGYSTLLARDRPISPYSVSSYYYNIVCTAAEYARVLPLSPAPRHLQAHPIERLYSLRTTQYTILLYIIV